MAWPFSLQGGQERLSRYLRPTRNHSGRVGEAFVEQKPLTLVILGQAIALPTQGELTLGRASPLPDDMQPDIDLTACGAVELGVSRRHVHIRREGALIYATDLGSANGTSLNGHRLLPNQKRILRNGDDLQLGHMVTRVQF
jgi:hypothetical protein